MIKKTFEDFILMLEGYSAKQSKLDSEIEADNPESWEKNKEFLHKFHETLEELPSPSWTDIAKSGRRALDSEEAWNDIHSELKGVGLTWEDVKANKEVILDNIDFYSSLNAYVDIILYNLDDNYNVGGWGVDVESDFDEILVKYRYGYHDTTYGGIFIKRYFGNVENFINRVASELLKYFILNNNIISSKAIKELESENYIIHLGNNNFKIYFEDFYHLCLEHRIVDIKNIQNFGEIICNYFENLGMTEDNYEIEDDWSFIYLKLSQD